MIGAGGGAGQGDAANLLKPALARGELRTIAATTWAEYKKYFEKDAALARRFQVVKVEEPDEGPAVEMMRGLVETLEKHHKVRILNEAVVDAVKLSNRYISGRQLPDKSVSLLDTTCARIGLSQTATPPAVEDCRRRIEQLDVAIGILQREAGGGGGPRRAAGRSWASRSKRPEPSCERLKRTVEAGKGTGRQDPRFAQLLAGGDSGAAVGRRRRTAGESRTRQSRRGRQYRARRRLRPTTRPLSDEERSQVRTQLAAAESQLTAAAGRAPAGASRASIRRPSPKRSPPGPASPSGGWSPTKSRRS